MNYSPLQPNDEIRIVAPSSSHTRKSWKRYDAAKEILEQAGFVVSYGDHVSANFQRGTAKPEDRAYDLNEAYRNPNVKLIMAMNGGWSANEVLPLLDWALIQANPKPLIGFSDITVLHNALYAMTQQPSYLGPNFGTFGSSISTNYTLDNFLAVAQQAYPIELTKSMYWGVYGDRKLRRTQPWKIISQGKAQGTLIGGNLGTFYLLQGTPYQPTFKNSYILVAEDDSEAGKYTAREFARRLESILQQPGARQNLQGIVIGRFEPDSKYSINELEKMLIAKDLGPIPIIANMDFGHTLPMLTLPIGGPAVIEASQHKTQITLVDSLS